MATAEQRERDRRRRLVDGRVEVRERFEEADQRHGGRPDPEVDVLAELCGPVEDRRLPADQEVLDAAAVKAAE